MLRRIGNKINQIINDLFRVFINKRNRKRLQNKSLTLISSNCNGCLILHDLGLRYNSPFVNLFINAPDYIKLLQNFSRYMECELSFIDNKNKSYPIGLLDDIVIHFVHYKNEAEAREKWDERKKRIDLSNCYVMFTDRDGCTEEHIRLFDELPFENKIVFTHKEYESVNSAFKITGFEKDECVGSLYHYVGWSGLKFYDQFDYVEWFNREGNK